MILRPEFLQVFATLAAPAAMLIAASILLAGAEVLPANIVSSIGLLPYLVAVAGVWLGWRFNRSRVVYAVLLVLLGYWLCMHLFPDGFRRNAYGLVAYAAYAVFLPINMAVLTFIEDRGVITPWGLVKAGVILAQMFVFSFVSTGGYGILADPAALGLQRFFAFLLHFRILPPDVDYWTNLPQPAILLFISLLVVLLIRIGYTRMPLDAGFAGTLAAVMIGLHKVSQPTGCSIFFATAGVILIVSLFQDSYRMAFVDELTGIPSRRALTAEFKKLGGRYAIAMADVDHFKKFNDKYGHDVGDQVLRMVASHLAEVGGGGKAFRYGGEEFTILFPKKTHKEALPYLEEVRKSIEKAGFVLRAKDRPKVKPDKKANAGKATQQKKRIYKVGVTVSIGVARKTEKQAGPEEVVKLADQALYKAKEAGRNQVVAK
jgi:diguanylate cyclase (GGDEF)-like protein